MVESNLKQSAHSWGEGALKLIQELDLQPYPQVYAIFFEYVRGSNKKLRSDIQKMLSDHMPFTEKAVEELHAKYIASDFDLKIVEESGERVQRIMSEVLNAIDNSAGDSKTFNKDLEKFSVDLEKGKGTNISTMLSKLIDRTNEFREKGENLQEKLELSRKEVDNLRTNLQEATTQMLIDGLTGVANRKAFDEHLLRFMHTAKTESRQLCLLMIDIDHFKKFNDTFGHLIGDQVIKIVAAAMKEMVKGKDFVARYGGEEFAVILPDTPAKGGQIVAESIRSAIATRELKRKDTGESYGQITVSIGVASYDPVRDKPEDLISRADRNLYISKRTGRNRVTAEGQV